MRAAQNGKQYLEPSDDIFAAISILPPGAEQDLTGLMEQLDVPTIAAFASRSLADDSRQSKTFYVLSGLPQQARVLVKFAREHVDDPLARIAVVYPESAQDLADAVIDECRTASLDNLQPVKFSQFASSAVADSLSHQRVRSVFFLGRGKEMQEMLQSAASIDWTPTVFQPGPLAGQEVFTIPTAFDQHVFLAFPMLPSDVGARGLLRVQVAGKEAQPGVCPAGHCSHGFSGRQNPGRSPERIGPAIEPGQIDHHPLRHLRFPYGSHATGHLHCNPAHRCAWCLCGQAGPEKQVVHSCGFVDGSLNREQ